MAYTLEETKKKKEEARNVDCVIFLKKDATRQIGVLASHRTIENLKLDREFADNSIDTNDKTNIANLTQDNEDIISDANISIQGKTPSSVSTTINWIDIDKEPIILPLLLKKYKTAVIDRESRTQEPVAESSDFVSEKNHIALYKALHSTNTALNSFIVNCNLESKLANEKKYTTKVTEITLEKKISHTAPNLTGNEYKVFNPANILVDVSISLRNYKDLASAPSKEKEIALNTENEILNEITNNKKFTASKTRNRNNAQTLSLKIPTTSKTKDLEELLSPKNQKPTPKTDDLGLTIPTKSQKSTPQTHGSEETLNTEDLKAMLQVKVQKETPKAKDMITMLQADDMEEVLQTTNKNNSVIVAKKFRRILNANYASQIEKVSTSASIKNAMNKNYRVVISNLGFTDQTQQSLNANQTKASKLSYTQKFKPSSTGFVLSFEIPIPHELTKVETVQMENKNREADKATAKQEVKKVTSIDIIRLARQASKRHQNIDHLSINFQFIEKTKFIKALLIQIERAPKIEENTQTPGFEALNKDILRSAKIIRQICLDTFSSPGEGKSFSINVLAQQNSSFLKANMLKFISQDQFWPEITAAEDEKYKPTTPPKAPESETPKSKAPESTPSKSTLPEPTLPTSPTAEKPKTVSMEEKAKTLANALQHLKNVADSFVPLPKESSYNETDYAVPDAGKKKKKNAKRRAAKQEINTSKEKISPIDGYTLSKKYARNYDIFNTTASDFSAVYTPDSIGIEETEQFVSTKQTDLMNEYNLSQNYNSSPPSAQGISALDFSNITVPENSQAKETARQKESKAAEELDYKLALNYAQMDFIASSNSVTLHAQEMSIPNFTELDAPQTTTKRETKLEELNLTEESNLMSDHVLALNYANALNDSFTPRTQEIEMPNFSGLDISDFIDPDDTPLTRIPEMVISPPSPNASPSLADKELNRQNDTTEKITKL